MIMTYDPSFYLGTESNVQVEAVSTSCSDIKIQYNTGRTRCE